MIGRLEKTVLDCPDPQALAAFYAAILGMRVNQDIGDWVVIGREPGARELAFQRVADYRAPDWPDPHRPQQLHLDIRVDDADVAEREVLALGARRLPGELEGRYRVFADPAGHPFCLVFGRPKSQRPADRAPRRERQDMTEATESADSTEPAHSHDPIEATDPKEPTEPIDSAEPVEPIDSTEPFE